MSLRKLPDVQNFAEPEGFESAPNIDAFDHWNPALKLLGVANAGASTVIEILDQIGKDPWTGEGIGPQDIADQLKGATNVVVNINSLGGSFYAGVTIYNLLKSHPGQVTCNVLGIAASAASIICMAGDVVNMGPAAFMMIHNGQGACMGDRHDMANAVTNLTAIDAAIRDLYVARTGKHGASISTMMDNETLMNASDAIKYGFADGMIAKAQIVEDVANSASGQAHPLHAKRLAEAILANAGVPRSKRRSMFAAIKNSQMDPGFAAAASEIGTVVDEIKNLRDLLRGVRNADSNWKCGADSGLPTMDTDSWDGAGAAGRMLAAATSDGKVDAAKAKAGFLFYDAGNDQDRASYKDPFADIVGGELKASRAGLRAAASRLPQTDDIPANIRDEAKAVVSHYEKKYEAADGASGTQNAADGGALDAASITALASDLEGLRGLLKPSTAT